MTAGAINYGAHLATTETDDLRARWAKLYVVDGAPWKARELVESMADSSRKAQGLAWLDQQEQQQGEG